MSDQKPIPGKKYRKGQSVFIVNKVENKIIYLSKLYEDGSLGKEKSIIWPGQWVGYEEVVSDTNNSESGPEVSKGNDYTFSLDEKTGEIVVTHNGVQVSRLKSIKGDQGDSIFEVWAKHAGLNPKDGATWNKFVETFKGDDGVGINAPSPYEEWKSRQPKGADTSWNAYVNSLRGEKGKDGYEGKDGQSAYDFWKSHQPAGADTSEEAFLKSMQAESIRGADGDTWEPRITPDGRKLYFVNSRTGDATEPTEILGANGADGESAYDAWKKLQPEGADTSIHAFLDFMAGKPGVQGPSGKDGKDGKTWKPVLSEDGQMLHFVNEDGQTTSEYPVVGATGKTGEQGPNGLSAYEIWLKEGHHGDYHDFLIWVAQQAEKGNDGADGDTYIPHVEKGVLFFISTKTGERINGGNVIGPEGKQGERGLDGHNLRHKYDYKTLYDFTCPIQKINPQMIAETGDIDAFGSPEQHMRETLNEIDNIRNEGRYIALGINGRKNPAGIAVHLKPCTKACRLFLNFLRNPLKEFFWWCAGADKPLLRMCPGEHSKYMGIGTVIFFTALMAIFSSYVAISYVFGGVDAKTGDLVWNKFAGLFAFLWGLMIFFLDRFITNTMYSDGKVTISWRELRSALPRILISIFLGIVISAPLELKIFKHEIDQQIVKTEKAEITKEYGDSLTYLSNYIDSLNNKFVAFDENKSKIEKYQGIVALNQHKVDSITKANTSAPSRARDKRENETTEQYKKYLNGLEKRNDANLQANSSQINVLTKPYVDKVNEYNTRIVELTVDTLKIFELKSLAEGRKTEIEKEKQKKIDSINYNKAGLYDRLAALHAIAYKEDVDDGYKPFSWGTPLIRFIVFALGVFLLLVIVSIPFTANVSPVMKTVYDNEDKPKKVLNFWPSFWRGVAVLWPWFAVVALICGYCNNAFFNALPYYIFSAVGMIMMLFILIDVSPVFYKMMLADGQYEQLMHKEKEVTQDLIRLNFAQSIAQVNNSEVGKLAPMIFSKPWEKIKSILSKTTDSEKPELAFGESEYTEEINEENKQLFDEVLSMKRALILAAYQAWYRDMRDTMLGIHKGQAPDPEDDDNSSDDSKQSSESEDVSDSSDSFSGGTNPDYERDNTDPFSGTPEDHFKDYERTSGVEDEESNEEDDDTDDVDDDTDENDGQDSESEDDEDDASSDTEEDEPISDDEPSDESDSEDDSKAESPNVEQEPTSDDSSNGDEDFEHVVDDDDDDPRKP